jgi:DNA-binding CsgD family transcriptional regulator
MLLVAAGPRWVWSSALSRGGSPRLSARVRESHSVRAVRESLERLEAKLGVRTATDAVAGALDESA